MIVIGTSIYLTRGDSESFTVALKANDGLSAALVEGDVVYFTVKEDINQTEKVLQKVVETFVEGKAVIDLLPSDTANLSFKTYVYDIQVSLADGTKQTIVGPASLTIGGEVTYE